MTHLEPRAAPETPLLRVFWVFWFLLVVASLVVVAGGVVAMYAGHEDDMRRARAATAREWVESLPLPVTDPDPKVEAVSRATRYRLNYVIDNPNRLSATDRDLFGSWSTAYPIPPTGWPHPATDLVVVLGFSIAVTLPFGIMTVIRWIITASWRLGPRW